MSPDEVLGKLKELGINITRKTLLNYESFGLAKPARGGGGRGIGRFTDYPPNTAEHAFAIYHMINSSNYSSNEVMRLAELIHPFMKNPFVVLERFRAGGFCGNNEVNNDMNIVIDNYLKDFFFIPILRYLTYFIVADFDLDIIEPINIVFIGGTDSVGLIGINKKYALRYDDMSDEFRRSEIDFKEDGDDLKYTSEKGIAKYFFANRYTGGIFEAVVKTNLNKK